MDQLQVDGSLAVELLDIPQARTAVRVEEVVVLMHYMTDLQIQVAAAVELIRMVHGVVELDMVDQELL
jgi:hypothetical protein